MDTTSIPHITLKTPAPSGTDPMLAAALMGRNDGGLFGSGANSLLPLLIGAFLFGGGRGLWGGMGGPGPVGAGAFAAEAVAAQSIYTPKDTAASLDTFKSWAQNNAAQLAQQCCCSTQQIISAVTGLSDRMFQTFVADAQAQTAHLNNMQAALTAQSHTAEAAMSKQVTDVNQNLSNLINLNAKAISDINNDIHDSVRDGFAASQLSECQTQNLINSTTADSNFKTASQICALSRQIAECCCKSELETVRLSALLEAKIAAVMNQMSSQNCEVKQAISAEGQATRALITSNSMDDLRGKLADAKAALSNAAQTDRLEDLIETITKRHCGRHDNGGSSPVTNNINIQDIATAVARALQTSPRGNS